MQEGQTRHSTCHNNEWNLLFPLRDIRSGREVQSRAVFWKAAFLYFPKTNETHIHLLLLRLLSRSGASPPTCSRLYSDTWPWRIRCCWDSHPRVARRTAEDLVRWWWSTSLAQVDGSDDEWWTMKWWCDGVEKLEIKREGVHKLVTLSSFQN